MSRREAHFHGMEEEIAHFWVGYFFYCSIFA
jgi:hypothetical protein